MMVFNTKCQYINIIDVARFMVKLRQLEYIQSVKFSSIDSKEVKESSEDSKDTFDFHLSVEFVNNETKDIEIEDQVEEGWTSMNLSKENEY